MREQSTRSTMGTEDNPTGQSASVEIHRAMLFLGGAATGALAGAKLGATLGPLAAAICAAVGALVGIFAISLAVYPPRRVIIHFGEFGAAEAEFA